MPTINQQSYTISYGGIFGGGPISSTTISSNVAGTPYTITIRNVSGVFTPYNVNVGNIKVILNPIALLGVTTTPSISKYTLLQPSINEKYYISARVRTTIAQVQNKYK